MSAFPSNLPQPISARHTPKARVLTPGLPGAETYVNQERDYSGAIQLEFFFTAEQTAVFYAWWKDDLLKGGKAFNATWPALRPGPMVCQMLSEPVFKHVYQGAYRVSVEVSVRGATELLPVCTFDPYFTCGPDGDPYWDNVTFLASMDSDFSDSSHYSRAATLTGSPQITAATPKWGPGCGLFDGSGSWVSYPRDEGLNFGVGDFTVEGWVQTSDSAVVLLDMYDRNSAGPWQIYVDSTGYLQWWSSNGGGSGFSVISTTSGKLNTGAWTHFAVTRNSGTLRVFCNGTQVGSTTDTQNYNNTVVPSLYIGAQVYVRNASYDLLGKLDDIRITKGIARYIANFTVPKAAYPDILSSNTTASLQQALGTTGWVASQPTRLTHKVVVTPFISSSWCAARVRTNAFAGKRYVEFKILGPGEDVSAGSAVGTCVGLHDATESQLYNNPLGTAQVAFSTVGFDHSGASIGYVVNGSSGIGSSAYAHATGDVIRLAFDQLTGGLWYAKNGGAWIGGGDPVAGTSPTHTLNRRQLVPYVTYYHRNLAATSEVQVVLSAQELQYGAPSGFLPWGDTNWAEPARTILLAHLDESLPSTGSVVAKLGFEAGVIDESPVGATFTPFVNYADEPGTGISAVTARAGSQSLSIRYQDAGAFSNKVYITDSSSVYEMPGDFTIKFSHRSGVQNSTSFRRLSVSAAIDTRVWSISVSWASSTLSFNFADNVSSAAASLAGASANTWYDGAVCRLNGVVTVYINGQPGTPVSMPGTLAGGRLVLAGPYNSSPLPNSYANGGTDTDYIDAIEVINGFAEFPVRTPDASCYQEKALSLTGLASLSADQVKFGSSAAFIPNTGTNTLSGLVCADHQDLDFGTQDFTIDLWAYRLANTYTGYLFWFSHSGGELSAKVATSGLVELTYRTSGGQVLATASGFGLNTWNHCAWQRRGTVFEFWLNGVLANSVAVPGGVSATVNSAGDLFFGRPSGSGAQTLNGYLDEIRVTRGVARYTEPFTPPTDPYCDGSDD